MACELVAYELVGYEPLGFELEGFGPVVFEVVACVVLYVVPLLLSALPDVEVFERFCKEATYIDPERVHEHGCKYFSDMRFRILEDVLADSETRGQNLEDCTTYGYNRAQTIRSLFRKQITPMVLAGCQPAEWGPYRAS